MLIQVAAERERRRRRQGDALKTLRVVTDKSDTLALTKEQQQYQAVTAQGFEALQAALREETLYVLFGGAKGGSKTGTGVRIMQHLVAHYEKGRYAVMRKNYTDLHDTTKQSFLKMFPPEFVVRKTESVWYCANGNEIWFYAADRSLDRNYEKTRGLELSAIFVDEASQFDEAFYELLPSLLRHDAYCIATGETLSGFIYMTTNPVPGKNWLKRLFIEPQTRVADGSHVYIAALPDNNPLLPSRYVSRAFSTMSGAMLKMLRYGDWDVEESDFKIIIPSDLSRLFTPQKPSDAEIIALGIDIGLGKPDKTVVYAATRSGAFFVQNAFEEYDTMRQVERLYDICRAVHDRNGKVCIDAAAVGKGVADRLQQAFYSTIQPVMFGETPQNENHASASGRYANRRAQLYFHARELIQQAAATAAERTKQGQEPEIRITNDEILYEELDNTYYNPSDGKFVIEPKEVIKKRLRRSPDHADAFVLCVSAWEQVKSATEWVFPSSVGRGAGRRMSISMPGD
jgi:hypothetical protein